MSNARKEYLEYEIENGLNPKLDRYVKKLEQQKAELEDQVQSLMTFLELLVDGDYIKDEGVLLLDSTIKKLQKDVTIWWNTGYIQKQ